MDELIVVVPVRDEGPELDAHIGDWAAALERLGIDATIRVYDDGSGPAAAGRLQALTRRIANLQVVHQANRGHGPTLVRAYREAADPWILQIDGDDEIGPDAFEMLWNRRNEVDVLIGARRGRDIPWTRHLVSQATRIWLRVTFGVQLIDANSPYRLMRRETVRPLVARIPQTTFAPNVALAAMAGRDGLRVLEVPVPCNARRRRPSSLRSGRLVLGVTVAALQTAALAARMRRDGREMG